MAAKERFRFRSLFIPVLIIFIGILFFTPPISFSENIRNQSSEKKSQPNLQAKKWRILHIMSYHSPWEWTDSQLAGFKDALSGLKVEYKVFQMDTKRRSSEGWKQEAGKEARKLISGWKPDLVFTSDDDVQKYVTNYYINDKIPFIFSAVNTEPSQCGFFGSKNITGILEIEHSVESFNLLKELVPTVKTVAVLTDNDAMWLPVIQRMKERFSQIKNVSFIYLDSIATYAKYKQTVLDYQTKADALALLGIFSFKDKQGKNVPYQDVLRWTAENSNLPDFSFWKDRATFGTLCVVSVSGYAQGMEAGKIAYRVLIEGKSPAEIPMKPTGKGEPLISLARANKLGIKVKSTVLLSSKVITKFGWEQ